MNAHDEHQIEALRDAIECFQRRFRIDRDPRGHTEAMTAISKGRGIFQHFDVPGAVIGARLRERLEKRCRISQHEMNIEEGRRRPSSNRSAHRRSHRQVWREVPVHHINMERVGPCIERRVAIQCKPRKICGENRRTDQRADVRSREEIRDTGRDIGHEVITFV